MLHILALCYIYGLYVTYRGHMLHIYGLFVIHSLRAVCYIYGRYVTYTGAVC
jgi:hypothetical protein